MELNRNRAKLAKLSAEKNNNQPLERRTIFLILLTKERKRLGTSAHDCYHFLTKLLKFLAASLHAD